MAISKAVLITGCSTGIGRATALRLAKAGHPVYATARKVDDDAGISRAAGCKLARRSMSATSGSIHAAVAKVEAEQGAVGVLINNAGLRLGGPDRGGAHGPRCGASSRPTSSA